MNKTQRGAPKLCCFDLARRDFVHVAPHPRLSRLNRTHKRMMRRLEVLGCMPVFRGVTTTHIPAGKAQPQMDPGIAGLYAVFANALVGRSQFDLICMVAFHLVLHWPSWHEASELSARLKLRQCPVHQVNGDCPLAYCGSHALHVA